MIEYTTNKKLCDNCYPSGMNKGCTIYYPCHLCKQNWLSERYGRCKHCISCTCNYCFVHELDEDLELRKLFN